MNWGIEDVTAAAALLAGAWTAIALVRRYVPSPVLRPVLIAAVLLLVVVIWAELAVGML